MPLHLHAIPYVFHFVSSDEPKQFLHVMQVYRTSKHDASKTTRSKHDGYPYDPS